MIATRVFVKGAAITAALLVFISPAGNAAAETPVRGGTAIAVLGADPAVLNPDISIGVTDIFPGCILYDALVRFGENFKIVPALAESWEIAPDGLTYTFHLVEASWHDGQPVTSQDVKFSLMEVSSKFGPKFIAPGKTIASIDTPDARTVVIHLVKPFGPFLFSLACEQNAAILPKHVFGGEDVLRHPATLTEPVGNGPFVLGEWVRGSHLIFTRNEKYWRKDEPYLDRLIIKVMPDPSARVLALQAGEVDFIDQYYFPLSAERMFANDKRFTVREIGYPSDDLIILNNRHPPLDSAKVRQALLIALDRKFIHRNVFLGSGQVAVSAIDTRIGWAHNPAIDFEKMYPHDPGRAAALLDEAGFPKDRNGTRFEMRLSFDTGRAEYTSWAQAIQRYWQAVGIKVVLEGAERPVVLKRVYSDYDFDATLQNYTTSGDPALGISRLYTTESIRQGTTFNNASGYSNPEVDTLFAKGADAPTEAERAALYFRVQEILARDLPTLVVHQQAQDAAASNRLRNLWEAANYRWWGSVWLQK